MARTDTSNKYWSHNGRFQHFVNALEAKVPCEGAVPSATTKNKALERFRKASNCYYDLYNNGLCNHARSFSKIFGIAASHYANRRSGSFMQSLYDELEPKMDEIVLAAAKEQGITAE